MTSKHLFWIVPLALAIGFVLGVGLDFAAQKETASALNKMTVLAHSCEVAAYTCDVKFNASIEEVGCHFNERVREELRIYELFANATGETQ